jgi:DNA-binding CsgD family transcriptional regulator
MHDVGGNASRILGRERELAAVRAFAATGSSAGALVLSGDPGIGKTTLWEAGIEAAREEGAQVLIARASSAEAQLSFAGLIDLLDGVDLGELVDVPAPQLAALNVTLMREGSTGTVAEPHAIGLGLLNALRSLAASWRLLIAVDDLQWLDSPSADALTFAARRLAGEDVCFLLARRPGTPSALERALGRGGIDHLDVGPLSFGATRRLLFERLGLSLSRQLLRQIVDATLGNPLFVLELGRVLAERGVPQIGASLPVPDTVEDLLGARVAELPEQNRRLLLAVALCADLRIDELAALVGAPVVEDAIEDGVVLVDSERVRSSHPLLAAAARKRSRSRERRELHLALANVVADKELRALHLALASEHPDDELAATLAIAAAAASARGARSESIVLANHALSLTPPASAARGERLLALAWYLDLAGEMQRLRELLEPELPLLPAGGTRARVWLLLSQQSGSKNLGELEHHVELALAECHGDPGLRAYVLAKEAANAAAGLVEGMATAGDWAQQAYDTPADRDTERLALCALAWVRALTGHPIDELCAQSAAESDASSYLAAAPERVAAQRLVWRGEVSAARAMLERLLRLADERGEGESYALHRLHLCELELRTGEWDGAERLLEEWAESDETGLYRPMYERCRALLAAGRGAGDAAETWAVEALRRADETASGWDRLEALRARGIAALLTHQPEQARDSLQAVWEHTEREGVTEPGVFPVAPELVAALAELGELGIACGVTGRLKELAEQQQHPWALVTARRCGALVALTAGNDTDGAGAELAQAAADYRRLGLPFEAARSLLDLGRALRRTRKWGAARRSLQDAIAAFEQLGSAGWAEQAQSELSRVAARRPAQSGKLTAAERRVAELAASGLSNKEIAQALYVTVYTVEAHLSHVYAKLGVRSRTALAGRLPPER